MTDRFIRAATGETADTRSVVNVEMFNKSNLIARLQYTPYGTEDYIDTLREEFDKKTKCLFQGDTNSKVYVSIAGRRDNFEDENGACRVKYGKLEVPRYGFLPLKQYGRRLTSFISQTRYRGRV